MKHYETIAGRPTTGETYAKLIEHLREAQDCCILMGHLHKAQDHPSSNRGQGWMAMGEMMGMTIHKMTELAKGTIIK